MGLQNCYDHVNKCLLSNCYPPPLLSESESLKIYSILVPRLHSGCGCSRVEGGHIGLFLAHRFLGETTTSKPTIETTPFIWYRDYSSSLGEPVPTGAPLTGRTFGLSPSGTGWACTLQRVRRGNQMFGKQKGDCVGHEFCSLNTSNSPSFYGWHFSAPGSPFGHIEPLIWMCPFSFITRLLLNTVPREMLWKCSSDHLLL